MLEGRKIIVSGAASGIGLAAALLFADYGATLMLVDVDETVRDIAASLPGAVATPMLTERGFVVNPGFAAAAPSAHPLGRIATPEEVAEAAAWLLSDKASFVIGHTPAVHGGLSAQ